MQPARIPLVVLTVNVMMVLTVTGLLVWTSMNAQHLILDSMNVANSHHVLIPLARMTVNAILRYQGARGMGLGMLEKVTGNSKGSLRNPRYAPTNTRGTEIPIQRVSNVRSVLTGTAPVDSL